MKHKILLHMTTKTNDIENQHFFDMSPPKLKYTENEVTRLNYSMTRPVNVVYYIQLLKYVCLGQYGLCVLESSWLSSLI